MIAAWRGWLGETTSSFQTSARIAFGSFFMGISADQMGGGFQKAIVQPVGPPCRVHAGRPDQTVIIQHFQYVIQKILENGVTALTKGVLVLFFCQEFLTPFLHAGRRSRRAAD